MPALDPLQLEFLVLVQGLGYLEPLLFVYGLACLGPPLPILDHVVSGFLLSLRSHARFDHVLSVFDSCRFASFLSPRSLACLESSLLVYGTAWSDPLMLTLDFVQTGPASLSRSLA